MIHHVPLLYTETMQPSCEERSGTHEHRWQADPQGTATTGNAGAGTPSGMVTGTNGGLSPFSAIQLTAKAVINQAVTAVRMRQIIASFQREYGA